MVNLTAVGKRMLAARKRAKLSQDEAAGRSGYGVSTIGRAERHGTTDLALISIMSDVYGEKWERTLHGDTAIITMPITTGIATPIVTNAILELAKVVKRST